MLFRPTIRGLLRLVDATDPAFATASDPALLGIDAVPGLRVAPVNDPQEIVDPFEIAYLAQPHLSHGAAEPIDAVPEFHLVGAERLFQGKGPYRTPMWFAPAPATVKEA